MRPRCERRRRATLTALVTCALGAALVGTSWASAQAGGDDPAGRGLQLLQARETALEGQAVQASQAARRRGRMLYRLLLHEAAERRSDAPGQASASEPAVGQAPGGRAIALGVAVLARDLDEAAALRDELARVRDERRSALAAAGPTATGQAAAEPASVPAPGAPEKLRPPVAGPIVMPWGVTRDQATGAWAFRTAVGYAPRPGEPVFAPAEGRVARVAGDGGGGQALVLVHPRGLTTVLAGLATVRVAPHELVRAGTVVGTAGATLRLELSRGRTPIDPAPLLAVSAGRRATARVAPGR